MKIFLLLVIFIFSSIFAFAKDNFDKNLKNLVLRAKVLEAKMDLTEAKVPRCKLKIEATFTNEGTEPIIILQPVKESNKLNDLIFSSGVSIYGKNIYGNYWIQVGGTLPSYCGDCNESIGKVLDKKTPPDKYTRILKPKESFTLIENSVFGMPMKTSSGIYGWDEIEKNDWKIVGEITYSMFPINLGKYGENFGYKLQKRWQKYGILYAGDNHSLITSEKFDLDLTNIKF